MSATASALLGGVPAAAHAVMAAETGGTSVSGGWASGPLTSRLAAKLSQDVDKPVIVILKSQASQV